MGGGEWGGLGLPPMITLGGTFKDILLKLSTAAAQLSDGEQLHHG